MAWAVLVGAEASLLAEWDEKYEGVLVVVRRTRFEEAHADRHHRPTVWAVSLHMTDGA
jgi:hypothetical protein